MKTTISFSKASAGVAILAAAILAGCATSTPQSRIANNPQIFGSLNSSQKGLVSQGKITEGMTKEAVYLAWGKADYVKQTSTGGRLLEDWIYTGITPAYTSYGGGFGYGYGYRGYGYGPYGCYDFGPRVYYTSYVAGKVTFHNGRVTQWEITNR